MYQAEINFGGGWRKWDFDRNLTPRIPADGKTMVRKWEKLSVLLVRARAASGSPARPVILISDLYPEFMILLFLRVFSKSIFD